jgi:phosphatidylglycerol lysyltransferase
MLTGGSIRYRFWASRVPTGAIARAVTFSMVTFWIGILAVGGMALLVAPEDAARAGGPAAARHPAGLLLVGSVAGYLGWNLFRRGPLAIGRWRLPVPGPRLAFMQLGVSVLDWVVAGGGAYLLLPDGAPSFPVFLGCFLLAQIVALVSHVPGGIGVFETMVVVLLAPWLPADAVLGALLVFRVLYYLLPFALAALLLVAYEVRAFGAGVAKDLIETAKGHGPRVADE